MMRGMGLLSAVMVNCVTAAGLEPPPGFEVVSVVGGLPWAQPPVINNCGRIAFTVVWPGESDSDVFAYDDRGLTRITDDEATYGRLNGVCNADRHSRGGGNPEPSRLDPLSRG